MTTEGGTGGGTGEVAVRALDDVTVEFASGRFTEPEERAYRLIVDQLPVASATGVRVPSTMSAT